MYFDLQLWRMTEGLRGRIFLAVVLGLFALSPDARIKKSLVFKGEGLGWKYGCRNRARQRKNVHR